MDDLALLTQAFGETMIQHATLLEIAQASLRIGCGPGPMSLPSPRDPVPAWWLVRSGHVTLGDEGSQGQFVEKACLGRGDWLDVAGAMSVPGDWLRPAYVPNDVELLALPLAALVRGCTHDEAFALAFGKVLATQVRALHRQLQEACTAGVGARVARWLLHEAACQGKDRKGASWTMSQRKQAVAQHLHTTPESLSRSLRQLCDEGVIRMRGYEVTLLDEAALRAMAEAAPRQPHPA